MTDELVKRYDVYPAYHGVDVEECHVGEFVYYADHADRIEALTAELADAEALIEAQAKDHASNNIRFAEAEHRAKTAEAERAHAWEMAAKADTQMGQSLADHLQAKAERDRLREALTFYADPETYQDTFVAEDCECCHRREHPAIEDDNGKVARAALKGETP